MNQQIKQHMVKFLSKGIRFDGRKPDEYRNIEVEVNKLSTAEGSAHVKIGDSEVIAGVKLQLEKPFSDRPDEGMLMVNAELLSLSNPTFEPGPPSPFAIELARVTDRGIRESEAIDLKELCIEKGEKVWGVMVDICTINADGNLFDAASLAAMLAIKNTTFPVLDEDGQVNYKEKTDKKLPIKKFPLGVTVSKVGEHLVIDPTFEEEEAVDARLTIVTTEDGKLCALQKGGESGLTVETIGKMVDLATSKVKELRKYLG